MAASPCRASILRDAAFGRSSDTMGWWVVRIGLQRLIPTSEIKMLKLDHTDAPTTDDYATVYVAFELSKAKWKLGVMVPGSPKMSRYTIAGATWRRWRPGLQRRARRQHGPPRRW